MPHTMIRRAVVHSMAACAMAAAVCLLLGGCASTYGDIGGMVKLAVQQHREELPTPAQVAANPYYQMYVHTRYGQAVLVLGNMDGDREAWYGKQGVVIFLRHGQVVKTTGLAQNLAGLRQPADNPFTRGLQRLTAPVTYTLRADWTPGYRYDVPVTMRLIPQGSTRLTILGETHDVSLVEEHVDAPAVSWHAVNRYWVDTGNGLIWKSEQQVAPGESITLVQLKPHEGAVP